MSQWESPSRLDRVPFQRGEADLAAAWAVATVVEVDPEGRVTAAGGVPAGLPEPGDRRPDDVYLGDVAGKPWFARPVERIEGGSMSWREAPEEHLDALAAALFLTKWARTTPTCERCGGPTAPDQGGARRLCPACGQLAFARMDPSIIVAITDPADRLLLARNVAWAGNRVSIIAGFLEAGESAEQACHREVFEEVGVRLSGLRYVGSQPWPMPRSLMLGFEARAEDDVIHVDGDEIVAGAYYSRADLAAAVSSGELVLPGGASIARHLIERWFSAG